MRILISGASGLIGRSLSAALTLRGDTVVALVRPGSSRPGVGMSQTELEGFGAVIHLAGENIAGGRWTVEKKRAILESRVAGTRRLAELLAALSNPPKVFITASAIGYYGHRGEELLDETAAPGTGFLPDVCRQWEAAALPAEARMRVAHIRIGIVLDGKGGALPKMKLPFEFCVGGRLGDGDQFMSWISLEDIVGAFIHVIDTPALTGPVNGVAPEPVRNEEFTRALARVLHRPALFAVPRFAVRLMLGEMADELILASTRVVPRRLEATGYRFRHPDLVSALEASINSR